MKKQTFIISSVVSVGAVIAIAVSLIKPPVDEIISPYLNETIIPLDEEPNSRALLQTSIFENATITDLVAMPDGGFIRVGQVLTERNIYVPAIYRSDFGGGGIWYTVLNPVNIDGIDYVPQGTSFNTIQQIIYVNPSLIYVIGTMQAKLLDSEGESYPLSGFFGSANVPIGDDTLVFVVSFTDTFTNVVLHGFLTPADEEGLQNTIVRHATLTDANTLVLTGVTNSHAGLFATAPNKPVFDFVMSVEVNQELTLNHLFSFNHATYAQPSNLYALADGDIIVSGQVQEVNGDFADIPISQDVLAVGFIARLDGETFTLEWVASNLKPGSDYPAVTQFLNVMELTNHHLITLANVWLDAESEDQEVVVLQISETGKILKQKSLTLTGGELVATKLLKAQTGYWLAGSLLSDTDTNIVLIKLNANLAVEFSLAFLGSGEELWIAEPFLRNNGSFLLPIHTTSKDQDFIQFASFEQESIQLFISLSA
ncbi:MAG: hypothetical protein RIS53_900 [Bacillota bacterium]|jgi:hypothetical protein